MIANIINVHASPVAGSSNQRVAFVDHHEMTWWVETKWPITDPKALETLLRTMLVLSDDPAGAIELGIVTKEVYEEALAARDAARAMKGTPKPERVM